MYQFFIENENVSDGFVTIEGSDVNHMKNVLRMKPGERIRVSTRDGRGYFCEVTELTDIFVRADILELTGGKKLWMNAYSRKQFAESDAEKIRVDETFLDAAGDGEFCFVENADVSGCAERIEEIYLYHWNRDYPADVYFPVDLSVWKCVETKEFAGSSHEKITRERYTR